jgi:hypothetical protein
VFASVSDAVGLSCFVGVGRGVCWMSDRVVGAMVDEFGAYICS